MLRANEVGDERFEVRRIGMPRQCATSVRERCRITMPIDAA